MAGRERSGPVGNWGLGGSGAIGGGGLEGRGRGGTDTVGAKTYEEGGDIARVRQGESFEGAIMVYGRKPRLGKIRHSFEDVTKDEEFVVGMWL